VNETVAALEAFRFNDAAGTVYHFVWHELCDWYIELTKEALTGGDAGRRASAQAVLVHCLQTTYLLLHPFMPFITEELWHVLRARVGADAWPDSIMEGRYPAPGPVDEAASRAFGPVIGIVEAIRNIRGEMNIPFKVALGQGEPVHVAVTDPVTHALLEGGEDRRVARLAGIDRLALHLGSATPRRAQSAVAVGPGFEVRVPLAGVIDLGAETARVDRELARVATDLALLEGKLSNPSFVERAPAEVVAKDRGRVEELREARRKLTNHRAMLMGADQRSEEEPMETKNPGAPAGEPQTPMLEKAEQVATAVAGAAKGAVEAVTAEAKELERKARPAIAKARKKAKELEKKARPAIAKAKRTARSLVAKAKKAVRHAKASRAARKGAATRKANQARAARAAGRGPARKAAKKK
jgi:valyl-tRNA synthetase